MQGQGRRRHASGNLRRVARARGDVWFIQARLPDGRQIQKKLGRVWSNGGRPPEGYYTKRLAEAALRQYLTDADRGVLPQEPGRSGTTFADACAEWLRHKEHVDKVRAGTVREYRSVVERHLLPAFGHRPVEDISAREIERWRDELATSGAVSNRTLNKILTNMNGVFERARRAYGLETNPVRDVRKLREPDEPDRIDPFTVEEVHALVRATRQRDDELAEQDAALFLTAAFTGLRRGELIGLRWRDVDFEGSKIHVRGGVNGLGQWAPTKGGSERAVPMVDEVAQALVNMPEGGGLDEDALVFPSPAWITRRYADDWSHGESVSVNEFLDASALARRFKRAVAAAGLRPRRFHDLRHTFGSLAISSGTLVEVQHWMGHAAVETTARYLHYRQRGDEAQRLALAFGATPLVGAPEGVSAAV